MEIVMDKCKPESLLNDKKLKVTKHRVAILDHIIVRDSSFCANDLYDELKADLDLVTIYRNLQVLSEAGILREVMNKSDRQYFELACVHNPVHPHFYCSSCMRIFCMKSNRKNTVSKSINFDEGFLIQEAVLNYNGICPDCRH
jgi:Fur family transcriptional regulator, ferric uptake regulator